jgi:hypothetical protein
MKSPEEIIKPYLHKPEDSRFTWFVSEQNALSAISEYRKEFIQKELEWLEGFCNSFSTTWQLPTIQSRIEELKLMITP